MKRESERTRAMMKDFMGLHEDGASIADIAQKYNLSKQTVYANLQTIADTNGVSRDSLLKEIHTPTEKQYTYEEKRIKVTAEELQNEFAKVQKVIGSLVNIIDKILEEGNE